MANEISNKLVSTPLLPVKTEVIRLESVKTEAKVKETTDDAKLPEAEKSLEITEVSTESINNTVNDLNNLVQNIQRDLNFRVDDESGQTIVTVLDSKTDEVIRQIPADHVLAISESIENLKGILFSAEV